MARLTITSGAAVGTTVEIAGEVVLGRENAQLGIQDRAVSRNHAVVRTADDGLTIEDLGSVNGTAVNGVRVAGSKRLRDGDVIEIGTVVLIVSADEGNDTAATEVLRQPELTLRHGVFPAIGDYAFLADGEVMALVAPSGNVEWMCLPRPDSPSVFGAILDRGAGGFRLGPRDVFAPIARRYVPGTMVLETTWRTRTGWLTVSDALAVGPWHSCSGVAGRSRPPSDEGAEHVLVRVARCTTGHVDVWCACEPVFGYGTTDPVWRRQDASEEGSAILAGGGETNGHVHLRTSMALGIEGRRAIGRHRLEANEELFVALSWLDGRATETLQQAHRLLDATGDYWRDWLSRGDFPDHPWSSVLQRSALTLKGLIYRPTGAILAAATTSLPETPTSSATGADSGKRNWDYRYTWVRDSAFTLWSLKSLGFREGDDYLAFLLDVGMRAAMQPVYAIDGGAELLETTVPLRGYENAAPVRVGNAAFTQQQNDVWGAIVDAAYLYSDKASRELSEDLWRLVQTQVSYAVDNWHVADRGIWEVRGEPRHFTSSKVMCWVACDRGMRLAHSRGQIESAARWRHVAEEIKRDVLDNAVDERHRRFTQSYGSTALDASLLLLPLVRFMPRGHELLRNTVFGVARELTEEGLVRRYRTDSTDDGLGSDEATFTICSFWLASAYTEIGEHDLARETCEKLLGHASPLQLYAEELEPRTGRHWGNFPQAFTHLALINAVRKVIAHERGERSGSTGVFLPRPPGVTRRPEG